MMVNSYLICDQWVLCSNSQDGAVSDNTVLAFVITRGGDYDHFAVFFAESSLTLHDCIVVGNKSP